MSPQELLDSRILNVDDQAANVQLPKRLLRDTGFVNIAYLPDTLQAGASIARCR